MKYYRKRTKLKIRYESYTPIVSVVGCVGALVSPVFSVSLGLSHSVQQLVSLCSQLVQIR